MNAVALASRMIARRRKIMLRSAIPLGVAAFVSVIAISVVQSVASEVRERERRELSGELSFVRPAESPSAKPEWPDVRHPDLYYSHAWITPGVVRYGERSSIAEIWFTDVQAEAGFRALGDNPRRTPEDTGTQGAARITAPGFAPFETTTQVTWNAVGQVQVLVPWEELPEAQGTPTGLEVRRIRGDRPLERRTAQDLSAEFGLNPTGWRQLARARMAPLWALCVAILASLYVAGAAAVAPAIGITVRRFSSEFMLLRTLGYRRGYVTSLIASSGAMVSGIAAAIGAIAAAVVLAVAGARGGIDPSVLPLLWLETQPPLGPIVPDPPIGAALVAVTTAALAGALASLPASRLPDTIGRHDRLWR